MRIWGRLWNLPGQPNQIGNLVLLPLGEVWERVLGSPLKWTSETSICDLVYLEFFSLLISHWTISCYNVTGIHGPFYRLTMTSWALNYGGANKDIT